MRILSVKIFIVTTLSFYIDKTIISKSLQVPKSQISGISSRPSAAAALPNLRILPIGDSITEGFGSTSGNGYRDHLQKMLNGTFPSATYIGSQRSGNMTNNVHEGYPGAVINEIASKALSSLVQQPNLILVMAGTNDMVRPFQPEDAPGRLGALIDSTTLKYPSSAIIAAQLTPITNPSKAGNLANVFNSKVPEILAVRQKAGKKVILVDMSEGFPDSKLKDGLHPSDEGYELMANTWYSGIQQAVRFGWIQEPTSAS